MKPPRAAHTQYSESGQRIPIRTCLVCRARLPQVSILRLGKDPSGSWQLDPRRRMVGRGVYVCPSAACQTPKALMRLSRADAARLALELENHSKYSVGQVFRLGELCEYR